MSKEFIYQMHGLKKFAPNGKQILDNIWLSFFPGAKIGVVGPNGAGKSTLLKIMAGIDKEFQGEVWLDPDARVGYLPQEPQLDENLTVRENIELGVAPIRALLTEFDEISMKFAEPMSDDEMNALLQKQAQLQDEIDAADAWNLSRRLDIAMDALRVPPGDSSIKHLSGGEKRRVALCQLLLSKPDLLLLDEPTNHLDAETVAWLERTLRDWDGTVIIVTHDRYFLDNVTQWILELEDKKGIPFEGNYTQWLEQKLKFFKEKGKSDSSRAKVLQKELDWVKLSQKSREERLRARLADYDAMQREAESNSHRDQRRDIMIPPGPRLGDVIISAKEISKGYEDRLLIDNLSFNLPPNGIVGVIGPNGAGKSTLFKMITGQEQPNEGVFEVGQSVKISYADQFRGDLDTDKTVWEAISHGNEKLNIGGTEINSRAYVGAFGFSGSSQQQKVSTLSGGERNRLFLAKILLSGGNLLLLDEPSNDLDVETLRSLESALEDFAGCAVVISHDRWFLDRIATHILAFEGDSQVVWFDGNYEAYEQDRRKRMGQDADQPHRIKFKPLER